MREMAKPIPVLIGSEYREKKTMKKQVKEKTAGIIIGTCEREKYREKEILKVWYFLEFGKSNKLHVLRLYV